MLSVQQLAFTNSNLVKCASSFAVCNLTNRCNQANRLHVDSVRHRSCPSLTMASKVDDQLAGQPAAEPQSNQPPANNQTPREPVYNKYASNAAHFTYNQANPAVLAAQFPQLYGQLCPPRAVHLLNHHAYQLHTQQLRYRLPIAGSSQLRLQMAAQWPEPETYEPRTFRHRTYGRLDCV